MICTRYDHLQRQRKKGQGQKDPGHAFVADAGGNGKFGGKRNTPRGARSRGGRREGGRGGRGRGETGREKVDEDEGG